MPIIGGGDERGIMRPKKARNLECRIRSKYFKPRVIPLVELEEVTLLAEEIEAIKLNDLDKLYQKEAAQQMNISRQTFARILGFARQKIADALVRGKALKLEQKSNGGLS
jgi:predicted DNA-binding protein (UPF0251 family)